MTSWLADAIFESWGPLSALLLFGVAPGLALRLIILGYPKHSPRRHELLAELYAVPRAERPFWVAEQFEVAVFEGIPDRWRQSVERRQAQRRPLLDGATWESSAARVMARTFRRRCLGVLIIDVDKFGAINERHGRAAGDAILSQVVQAVRTGTTRIDVIGRLGGDEFGILLSEPRRSCRRNPAAIGERIRQEIAATVAVMDQDVTISVGGALAKPGSTLGELKTIASAALVNAKDCGRNMVRML